MRKMPATLAAVVLPMVTLTTAALAGDDDKTYPGAMCRLMKPFIVSKVPTIPSLEEVIDQINAVAVGVDINGAMENFSPVAQAWICPVVREWMKENPTFARITVKEPKDGQVTCDFEARDPLGENLKTSPWGKREVQKTFPLHRVVTYTWGGGDGNALPGDVPDHGYYYFKCVVPGRFAPPAGGEFAVFGVITYKVSEDD